MRTLRVQHAITMSSLCDAINISTAYLSSLERGKKGSPSKELLQKIISYFSLSEKEISELQQAVEESRLNIKMPEGADPDVYRVANLLSKEALNLTKFQTNIITTVLMNIPPNHNKEVNI